MEILTAEQMRRVDRHAILALGIPSLELMEAAGRGVAEAVLADYPDASARGVWVLCGKGNNGGDGLVVARHLARRGVVPEVLLLARGTDLQGDAAANLRAAREAGLEVHEVADEATWEIRSRGLEASPLVVDAMLGTGVRGGARGLVARVIADLDRRGLRAVSIDLPSGLDGDTGAVPGPAVRAERTYTLARPKLALLLSPAADRAGSWRVIPIGIPDEAVRAERVVLEWFDAAATRGRLPRREAASHKGTYGHLLGVAGSRGKSGAAVLLARGALRTGVGLVTVATPQGCLPTVAAQQAELMTEPLAETAAGTLTAGAAERVTELAAERSAVALGPGLGTHDETARAARRIVADCRRPMVVDADGLNALAPLRREAPLRAPDGPALVLTPHPGEAARLLGCSTRDVQGDRLAAAREIASRSGALVVLKGHRSLVAAPDGRASFNASGNPGLATAGTGDVLTGVIGALLARRLDAFDAARLGTFLHGDAGDRAARDRGLEGLIASDVVDALPEALADV